MEKKTLYLICNAHLDPVWLWNMEEGISAALSTFHTAADFCENYDGFVFNHNEALLYQWIEEYDLPLFERIQKLVKAGKWPASPSSVRSVPVRNISGKNLA